MKNIWKIISFILIGLLVIESGLLVYSFSRSNDSEYYKQHYIDYCEMVNSGSTLINAQTKLLNLYGYDYRDDWKEFDCDFWIK